MATILCKNITQNNGRRKIIFKEPTISSNVQQRNNYTRIIRENIIIIGKVHTPITNQIERTMGYFRRRKVNINEEKTTQVRRNKITYLQHKQDDGKIQIRGNSTDTNHKPDGKITYLKKIRITYLKIKVMI